MFGELNEKNPKLKNEISEKKDEDDVPPQYKGMKAEAVEGIWTIPEYMDIEKTRSEKERKGRVLEFLRNSEKDEEGKEYLELLKTQQEADDSAKLAELRKNFDTTLDQMENLPIVKNCKQALESKMLTKDNNKKEAYERAIYEMLTIRSEFVKMREESGGDLVVLREKFKSQTDEYRDKLLPQISKEVESHDMKWESNPAWLGVNTRPEAGKREGLNFKSYFTIPIGEYSYVNHIPALAEKLRKLAIDSDDIVQVKIPNGLMGFMSHNDSIVIHCKKKENAEASLQIVKEWMKEHGITEASRELGRTQIAADGKKESFTQLVSQNIGNWLAEHEGKYEQSVLIDKAIEYAIEYSKNPPKISEK